MISNLHSFDAWKLPGDAVFVEEFQAELNVREHDISLTSHQQIETLTVVFPRLDHARGELAPDTVRLDKKPPP